jgi:hypothetical protein
VTEEEIQPFTVTEAQRILAATAGRRNGVRFALALALRLRQGEALGLPAELVAALQGHRSEQDAERELAADLWHDAGWLFAQPTGSQSIHVPTTRNGKRYSRPPASAPPDSTTPATPPPRCSWFSRSPPAP